MKLFVKGYNRVTAMSRQSLDVTNGVTSLVRHRIGQQALELRVLAAELDTRKNPSL
ncbi:hypothetical protein GRI44_00990 [Altererythrobacter confluentis]|uniref:Uncharacterized protein n=1 Tax=Allopontixanthobacter confluentis TaxID=1849021 RepID=A0A6L7GDR5_9SPHN|nr:hypothetical protein [Allopontixanthobacter confluentis]MXP13334.1 hypothetical protein [Allopontixanthobacter confluentis]